MQVEIVFWHLVGFLAPALGVPALAAALAKLVWFRALRPVSWWRLAWPSMAAALVVWTVGLVVYARDGRLETEAALVVVVAATLGWVGFRRR